MGEQIELLKLEKRDAEAEPEPIPIQQLKLRKPDRRQITYAAIEVERLVSADDPVRAIWELVGQLDLSRFSVKLRTRKNDSGRGAWDPQLLTSIWIWGYSQAISSARELERQCDYRPQLQWLCGMETVNHHSLSDFRSDHGEALDDVFTQVLAVLSQAKLIDLEQVTVDGTRVRSQGSTSSQRKRLTIEDHLEQARAAVQQLNQETVDETAGKRREAAKRRAADERVARMEEALEQLQQIEASKKNKAAPARVSASEPEARVQHESNGGFALGYNAQLATDAKEAVVVGVELSNKASDSQQLEPTLNDVKRRLRKAPKQALADEGYNSRANIKAMEEAGIEYLTPAPAAGKGSQAAPRAAGIAPGFEAKFFIWDEATDTFRCPAGKTLKYRRTSHKRNRGYRQYQGKRSDCAACELRMKCCPKSGWRTLSRSQQDALMARHRQRMSSERAKAAYRTRSQTAEFPNAWLKERFGVRKFRLKGLRKARAELLWAILAYNVRTWVRLVWRAPRADSTATALV